MSTALQFGPSRAQKVLEKPKITMLMNNFQRIVFLDFEQVLNDEIKLSRRVYEQW